MPRVNWPYWFMMISLTTAVIVLAVVSVIHWGWIAFAVEGGVLVAIGVIVSGLNHRTGRKS